MSSPYLQDPDLTIWNGDVREVLRSLPDESVQMCVTSPPYWGLRDYGNEGQIGLEPTPEAYVEAMAEVFREVRRVLRKDGTLWLNLGDSYIGGGNYNGNTDENLSAKQRSNRGSRGDLAIGRRGDPPAFRAPGLKSKDLAMIPARVALALQADGWYLRSEITWCKPNPMPESVTDRPTQATEKVYLFSKASRYFYDAEAVREDSIRAGDVPGGDNGRGSGSFGVKPHSPFNGPVPVGRNLRNWWEIATEPYPETHFATYPTELVRRCILAGSAEGDVVLDPFGGSGTTAYVARKHGRRTVLIELSADYCALAARRTQQLSLGAEAVA